MHRGSTAQTDYSAGSDDHVYARPLRASRVVWVLARTVGALARSEAARILIHRAAGGWLGRWDGRSGR